MRFFLISQGSLNPKIRFLVQKVCPVACLLTDRPGTQTDRVTTVVTLSELKEFFLQLIIKDRPNKRVQAVRQTTWHMGIHASRHKVVVAVDSIRQTGGFAVVSIYLFLWSKPSFLNISKCMRLLPH